MMSSICSKAASSIKLTSDVILTNYSILYFNTVRYTDKYRHPPSQEKKNKKNKIKSPLRQFRKTDVDVNVPFIFIMDVAHGFRAFFHYVAISQSAVGPSDQ